MATLTIIFALLSLGSVSFCESEEAGDKSGHGYTSSSTISAMLKGYDKAIRPDSKSSTKITVSMYFEYTKWQRNELHSVLYLRQAWSDPRLKRTSDYTRFKASDLIDRLWTPNTYFTTGVKRHIVNEGFVDVSTSGDVLWSHAMDIRIPCPLDAKMAYETDGLANCTVLFESYSLVSKDVVYEWDKTPISQSNFPDVLTSHDTSESHNKYPSGEYSGLIIKLEVQTKANKAVLDFRPNDV